MNFEAAALAEATRRDVEAAGGPGRHREHALASLRLRTVVREPHGAPVLAVAFNHADEQWRLVQQGRGKRRRRGGNDDERGRAGAAASGAAANAAASAAASAADAAHSHPTNSNLVATVGGGQVTVYDDRHMGDYVAVVMAHAADDSSNNNGNGAGTSTTTRPSTSTAFTTCAWVSARGWTPHPHGDAVLAAGGESGVVSVLSVAEAAVVAELDAREAAAEELEEEAAAATAAAAPQPSASRSQLSPVLDLSPACGRPGLLLVLGGAQADDQPPLALWHVPSGRRLALFAGPASPDPLTCAALHPEARCVVAGDARGRLWAWQVPFSIGAVADTTTTTPRPMLVPGEAAVDVTPPEPAEGQDTAASIDCVQFLPLLPTDGTENDDQEGEDDGGANPNPGPRWALAAKASDGRVHVLAWPDDAEEEDPHAMQVDAPARPRLLASWRVPDDKKPSAAAAAASTSAPSPRSSSSSSFATTPDGRYLAVGGAPAGSGCCFVFETRTGREVCRFELPAGGNGARRAPGAATGAAIVSSAPSAPRAVALSGDGRHALVAAGSAGWVLRYEARRDCGAAAAEAQKKEQQQQQEEAATKKRGRSEDSGRSSDEEDDDEEEEEEPSV